MMLGFLPAEPGTATCIYIQLQELLLGKREICGFDSNCLVKEIKLKLEKRYMEIYMESGRICIYTLFCRYIYYTKVRERSLYRNVKLVNSINRF